MQRTAFRILAGALAAAVLALVVLAVVLGESGYAGLAVVPFFFLVVHGAYGPDAPMLEAEHVPMPRAMRTPTTRPAPTRPTPAPATNGAFTHNGYTLHAREANGRTLYFFAKSTPKSGVASPLPPGYEVGVNGRTGLPFLRRGGAQRNGHASAASDATNGLAKGAAAGDYRPQCSALRNDGVQCRNSARGGSKYCASHFGHQPRTAEGVVRLTDTTSKVARVDTATSFAGDKTALTGRGAQCQALTASGGGRAQCKNTVRPGSQFCVAHQGYRSPTPQKVVRGRDSAPRVRGAPDTLPSVRRRTAAGP